MVRIVVEVAGGGTRFRTAVRAESIERAVVIASAQHPDSEVSVLFPIDPEMFFGEDAGLATERIQPRMPEVETSLAGGARARRGVLAAGEMAISKPRVG